MGEFDLAIGVQMREGQQFSWETLPARCEPILPGTVPVLEWLAQERARASN